MDHLEWFHEARYGMFIHWGAYSVAGRGEWVANRERIPKDEYTECYVRRFTASRYDPRAWAQLASDAGMKYMVLTTRHHDGFALWDTKTTDFNAVKMGPGRDLVAEYCDAVRAAGLKLGFYLSGADWYHPDYPGACARSWPARWAGEQARERFLQYYRAQVEELLTQYGKVDLLWHDGNLPQPFDAPPGQPSPANVRARELQPHIVINERNGVPYDYRCSEQTLQPHDGPWEACMTLNRNWGFHQGDHDWKTPKDVVRLLTTAASKAGNLLLNVGPREDGTIPEPSVDVLRRVGRWLLVNREFLPNSDRLAITWNNFGVVTAKRDRLYLHVLHHPGDELCYAELTSKVLLVRTLHDGRELPFKQEGPRVRIHNLPQPLFEDIATTVVLELDGPPQFVDKERQNE